jgi:hypothetical protein
MDTLGKKSAQVMRWLIGHWLSVAALVLAMLILVGAVGPASHGRRSQAGKQAEPREYIYLDSARVNSYLGQVNDGESTSESLRETIANSREAKLVTDVVGAASSEGEQRTKSAVVTKSEADKFSELLADLEAKESREWLGTVNVKERCKFISDLGGTMTPDGSIVMIKNAEVQVPSYMSAFPELRHATYRPLPAVSPQEQLVHGKRQARQSNKGHARVRSQGPEEVFGTPPLTSFRATDESVRGTPKREQQQFASRVGRNPRIPFSFTVSATVEQAKKCKQEEVRQKKIVPNVLEPKAAEPRAPRSTAVEAEAVSPSASGQAAKITVVLPARFVDLTGDPSLLSVPLTIVGLVVDKNPNSFGDGTSVSSYWPALSVAKAPLLRELGVRREYLKMGRVAQREHLFRALERSLTYEGPVVEIVPIAMYD